MYVNIIFGVLRMRVILFLEVSIERIETRGIGGIEIN